MNAKKSKTALLALILLAGSFFIASAENNSIQYIVQTQYFDIIYKAPSRETAKLISENVDQIYLDVRNSLKVENFYHFKNSCTIEQLQEVCGLPSKRFVSLQELPQDRLKVVCGSFYMLNEIISPEIIRQEL